MILFKFNRDKRNLSERSHLEYKKKPQSNVLKNKTFRIVIEGHEVNKCGQRLV
jgi:hypothetical protein